MINLYKNRLSLLGPHSYLVVISDCTNDQYWDVISVILTKDVEIGQCITLHTLDAGRGMNITEFNTEDNFVKSVVEYAENRIDVALNESDQDKYFRLFSSTRPVDFEKADDSESELRSLIAFGPAEYTDHFRRLCDQELRDEDRNFVYQTLKLRKQAIVKIIEKG